MVNTIRIKVATSRVVSFSSLSKMGQSTRLSRTRNSMVSSRPKNLSVRMERVLTMDQSQMLSLGRQIQSHCQRKTSLRSRSRNKSINSS